LPEIALQAMSGRAACLRKLRNFLRVNALRKRFGKGGRVIFTA
jgi:hypothetical protein